MIEDKDFIKYCMSRLSADERKFIEYRYYDEKSQKEISEIMGIFFVIFVIAANKNV